MEERITAGERVTSKGPFYHAHLWTEDGLRMEKEITWEGLHCHAYAIGVDVPLQELHGNGMSLMRCGTIWSGKPTYFAV